MKYCEATFLTGNPSTADCNLFLVATKTQNLYQTTLTLHGSAYSGIHAYT